MKKIFLVLIFLTLGCLLFLHYTNDHRECDTQNLTTTNDQGEKVTLKKHICNERFAF